MGSWVCPRAHECRCVSLHVCLPRVPEGLFTEEPGTKAAHSALFSLPYPSLSLLHHHGTESDDTAYDSGNVEPRRGFGHIAFTTEDGEARLCCPSSPPAALSLPLPLCHRTVYASCAILESEGASLPPASLSHCA